MEAYFLKNEGGRVLVNPMDCGEPHACEQAQCVGLSHLAGGGWREKNKKIGRLP